MACRNLTIPFMERRDGKKVLGQLEEWTMATSLLEHDVELGAPRRRTKRENVIPAWVNAFEEAQHVASTLEMELQRMASLRKKRRLVSFKEERDDLDDLTERVGTELRRVERDVIVAQFSASDRESEAESKAKASARKRLAKRYQDITRRFRNLCDDKKNPVATVETKDQSFFPAGEESMMLASLEERRDEDIDSLAASVNEVAIIFKELAVLVIDQGTILDRIDYNMEAVTQKTARATSQIVQAENYDRQTNPIKFFILLATLNATLFAILVYKRTAGY